MYLKRLELKGFKSFADKSVLTLEPGISAIVGPNGSGKSNICDAILWVLGERNAKSLRGSVMEDVIFAGSSERNAVSVAEVSLILDNSDGVLPVDYNEVSLTRRLYRSGESEYLINDIPSRRLDVLDILHDSGLGTDTNSIISQGNLDSILQSKPVDRRALIEEAAGVLKHKRRKIRSENKINRMDQNLARIGDVMAEIERQLKPLRIKAKRAAAYDGLCAELSDLTLQLAVDDLKNIKKQWDEKSALKEKLLVSVAEKREAYDEAESALARLRQEIASQSSDIMVHTNRQRKLNSVIEKLEGIMMLIEEKANNAQKILDTAEANIKNGESSSARQAIIDEIKTTSADIDAFNNEISSLNTDLEESKILLEMKKNEYHKEQKQHDEAVGANQDRQNEASDIRKKLNDAQDSIIEAQSKTKSAENRISELSLKTDQLKNQVAQSENDLTLKAKSYDWAEKQVNNLHKQVLSMDKNLCEYRDKKDNLNQEFLELSSEISALKKIIASKQEKFSSASKIIESKKDEYGVAAISDILDIDEKYLPIVEIILDSYTSSYAAYKEIVSLKNSLYSDQNAEGFVKLLTSSTDNENLIKDLRSASQKYRGEALSNFIDISSSKFQVPLFDAVIVFSDSETASNCHSEYSNLICASLDGSVFFPDGRVVIGRNFDSSKINGTAESTNILSYKKNLKKLDKRVKKIERELSSINQTISKSEDDVEKLRNKDISMQTQLAKLQGEVDVAKSKERDLKQSLDNSLAQLEAAYKERDLLKEAYSSTAPEIENLNKRLIELEGIIVRSSEQIKIMATNLENARDKYYSFNSSYNDKNNKLVALQERKSAANHILDSDKKRLNALEAQESKYLEEIKVNQVIVDRSNQLANIIISLEDCAKKQLIKVDNQAYGVNQRAKDIQVKSDNAIKASNNARKMYEKENSRLSEIKIELGRLDVQVQNAVDAIDAQDKISVDTALEMPDIEDRPDKENRAFRIRRRIANMGTINPDAKEDYEKLKERYDFLNEQVEDLRSARISLQKITKIIDSRMKDDFINTFEQVNNNFQEIFEVLFPGGHAHLELDIPEDPENSGVEVKAQPKGKRISKMSLMSGGEKSLVALCLLFAVYKTRSTPFYILDEVEAALDDTNLRRLIKYLSDLCRETQLIMITHQRRTMEMADVLYGVSMKANGITKVVSQRLDKTKLKEKNETKN